MKLVWDQLSCFCTVAELEDGLGHSAFDVSIRREPGLLWGKSSHEAEALLLAVKQVAERHGRTAHEVAESLRVLPLEWLSFFKPSPMTAEEDWGVQVIFEISKSTERSAT